MEPIGGSASQDTSAWQPTRMARSPSVCALPTNTPRRRRCAGPPLGRPAPPFGRLAVLGGLDDHQPRMAGFVRSCGMHMQLAEAAAEVQLLLRCDALVAEEDHAVLGQRPV